MPSQSVIDPPSVWLLLLTSYDGTEIYGAFSTEAAARAGGEALGGPEWADCGYQIEAFALQGPTPPAVGEYKAVAYWPTTCEAIRPRVGDGIWVTTREANPYPEKEFIGYGATRAAAVAAAEAEAVKYQPTNYRQVTSSNNSSGTLRTYWERPWR
jgi:hypothetical protein